MRAIVETSDSMLRSISVVDALCRTWPLTVRAISQGPGPHDGAGMILLTGAEAFQDFATAQG